MPKETKVDDITKQNRLQQVVAWIDDGHNSTEMFQLSAGWGVGQRQFYNYMREARDIIRKQASEWTLQNYSAVRASILARLDALYNDPDATLDQQLKILQEIHKVSLGGDATSVDTSGTSGLADVPAEDIKARMKLLKGKTP